MHKKLLATSSGSEPYEVVFELRDGKLSISCSCKAAAMNMACKHRLALIRGERDALFSAEQVTDLNDAKNWAEASGLSVLVAEHDSVESEVERLQAKLKKMKKALASAMG